MEALQVLTLAGCVALVGCADREPPRWSDDAELRATLDGEGARLVWPEATDNEHVVAYRVLRGGEVIAEVQGGTMRRYRVGRIPSGQLVSFGVRAVDEAGLVSAPLRAEIEREDTVAEAPPTNAPPQDVVPDTDAAADDGPEPARTQGVPTLQSFTNGQSVHGRPPMTEAERARRGLPIRRRISDRVVGGTRLGP